MKANKTKIVDTLKNAFFYKEGDSRDDYEEEYELEEQEEIEDEVEEKPKKKKSFFSSIKKEESIEDDDSSYNISTVIVSPKSFKEAIVIAKHINNNKMVTVNLENTDKYTMQRILDFLSGAMEMKNAAYAQISKTVFTIVPEKLKVLYEGDSREQSRIINLEREEK